MTVGLIFAVNLGSWLDEDDVATEVVLLSIVAFKTLTFHKVV